VVDRSASESVTGPGQSPARVHRDSRLFPDYTRRITLSPPKSLAGCAMRTRKIHVTASVCDLLRRREFSYRPCKTISVRFIVVMVAALIGVGALMPPTAAAGPTVCDYPACTPGIRSEHGVGRAVRQHHLLRIRCLGWLRARHPTRTADVMRLAQAIPAEMVPLTADGGHQGRKRRLPSVFELLSRRGGPDGLFLICIAQEGHPFWTRADT